MLNTTFIGRNVLKFYEDNKKIDEFYRKQLTTSIIQYIIENDISASPKLFSKIADNIVELFPSETKVSIYKISYKSKANMSLVNRIFIL